LAFACPLKFAMDAFRVFTLLGRSHVGPITLN